MRSRYVLIACLAALLVAAPAVAETEPVDTGQHITMTVMPEDMLSVDVQDHLHFHIIEGNVQSHGFHLNFMNTTLDAWEVTVRADGDLKASGWTCPEGEGSCYEEVYGTIDIDVLSIVFDLAPYDGWGPNWNDEGIEFFGRTLSTDAQVIVTGVAGTQGGWGIGHRDDYGDELRMDLDLSTHVADGWLDYETTLTYTMQTVTSP